MVIGRMVDLGVNQVPVITEIVQEALSVLIFGIYVGITSDEQ